MKTACKSEVAHRCVRISISNCGYRSGNIRDWCECAKEINDETWPLCTNEKAWPENQQIDVEKAFAAMLDVIAKLGEQ